MVSADSHEFSILRAGRAVFMSAASFGRDLNGFAIVTVIAECRRSAVRFGWRQ